MTFWKFAQALDLGNMLWFIFIVEIQNGPLKEYTSCTVGYNLKDWPAGPWMLHG